MKSLTLSGLFLILALGFCAARAEAEEQDQDPLAEAWTHLLVRNYAQASKLFHTVAEKEKNSTRGLIAEAGIIMAQRCDPTRFNRDETIQDLKRVLDKIPASEKKFRCLILYQLALAWQPGVFDSTEMSNESRKKSIPYYEQIQREAPGSVEACIATVDLGNLLMTISPDENTTRVTAMYLEAVKKDIPPHGRRVFYQAIANQYRVNDDWANAEKYLCLWTEAGMETDWLLAQTLYSIATINHLQLKNYPKAIEYYERIGREYPFFGYASECRKRAKELRQLPPGASAPSAPSPNASSVEAPAASRTP